MSEHDALRASLLVAFREEAFEELDGLQADLIQLECAIPEHREALLSSAFRHAHTLKGAAASVELQGLRQVAHSLETLFGDLRDGRVSPSAAVFDAANRAVDQMRELTTTGLAAQDPVVVGTERAAEDAVQSGPSTSPERVSDELMALFASDAAEQFSTMEGHLIELERAEGPQREHLLQDLFRQAHNLKGNAGAVELTDLSALAHAIEDVFTGIQSGAVAGTAGLFDVVHETIDGMRTLVDAANTGEPATVPVAAYVTTLQAVTRNAAPAPGPAPSSAPAPPAPIAADASAAPAPGSPAAAPAASTPTAGRQAPSADRPENGRAQTPATGSRETTVRVPVAKLDTLLVGVGELLAVRIAAEQRHSELQSTVLRLRGLEATHDAGSGELRAARLALEEIATKTRQDVRRLGKAAGELQDGVRSTRMLPMLTILGGVPRLVRDLSRELGKDVELRIDGAETEVDKTVIEQLKAPLTHLIRNSLDHGLETPQVRVAAGKPAAGSLVLHAAQQGAQLVLRIADDGAGIDGARVRGKAVEQGLLDEEAAGALSDAEAHWLIFAPGFSTRSEVTDVSGRGVGMDVVRVAVEQLGGTIEVESTLGGGTAFTLVLPLSVASTRGLFVRAGGQTVSVPVPAIDRILRIRPGDVGCARGRRVIVVDQTPIVITELAHALGLPADRVQPEAVRSAFVLGSGDRRVAFMVDELVGGLEMVVKQLPQPLRHVRNVAGATTLASGEVVLVLSPADVLRAAAGVASATAGAAAITVAASGPPGANGATGQPTPAGDDSKGLSLLVVEDSATIRMLETQMLEGAGYRVTAAVDGAEGWALLQHEPFDAVVSDVEMPRMGGFELARRVRADHRLRDLPFILVTSLESASDRRTGLSAGADAYVVKGTADQERLVETVARLV